MDQAIRRRFFAEEIQAIANLSTPSLIEALASIPREAFLRKGPWLIVGEADLMKGPRPTADADPRHVYHNVSVAIDASRMLFNGQPGIVSMSIDALGLEPGQRVLHIGAGLGYYTAILAHCVGESGRVLAIEADPGLAGEAASNLSSLRHVEVQQGDASEWPAEAFDAVLFSAGVTHIREAWLDRLAPRGRIVLPVTASFGPPSNISKGILVRIADAGTREAYDARVVSVIAIYSAVGLRDDTMNGKVAEAFKRMPFPPLRRLRRDPHEVEPSCWLHGDTGCLST